MIIRFLIMMIIVVILLSLVRLLAGVVVWFMRQTEKYKKQDSTAVECSKCGVYSTEGFYKGGKFYCSRECFNKGRA